MGSRRSGKWDDTNVHVMHQPFVSSLPNPLPTGIAEDYRLASGVPYWKLTWLIQIQERKKKDSRAKVQGTLTLVRFSVE